MVLQSDLAASNTLLGYSAWGSVGLLDLILIGNSRKYFLILQISLQSQDFLFQFEYSFLRDCMFFIELDRDGHQSVFNFLVDFGVVFLPLPDCIKHLF